MNFPSGYPGKWTYRKQCARELLEAASRKGESIPLKIFAKPIQEHLVRMFDDTSTFRDRQGEEYIHIDRLHPVNVRAAESAARAKDLQVIADRLRGSEVDR